MKPHDEGHRLTEQELAELERHIREVYEKAREELEQTIREYFAKLEERDKHQQELLKAGKITEEQYKQWRLNQIGRGERFEALRDEIARRYTEANEVVTAYINDHTPGIYSLNRNYAAYTIEQVAGNVGFTLWDEQTVRRLLVEDPDLMPEYPAERALRRGIDLAWGKQQITASVTSGILQGKSVGRIATDLQDRIEGMNRSSALRAARTAVTGAQNAGRQDSYIAAEKMGIKMKREWLATLDGRTRHAHAVLDGQRVAVDEPFYVEGYRIMFPGDPRAKAHLVYNCRCTLIAVVDGVDTSDAQRRAIDPETGENVLIEDMTYREWMKWKRAEGQESDFLNSAGRKLKSMITGEKVVAFSELPDKMKTEFREGLVFAHPDVKKALRNVYRTADYILSDEKRSYYSAGIGRDIINIGTKATTSTLAHELFHKLDKNRSISAELFDSLMQDFLALNVKSDGDVKTYLANQYADAFTKNEKGITIVKEPYRGIGDILNGLSGGEVSYGYGHSKKYWIENGRLESEAWAQFGRVYYENNPDVVNVFEDIFPHFVKRAMDKLRRL